MNFKLSKRLMALPFTTAERAVTTSIAFHVDKDGDSSWPSYKTIHKESGAANKTISKVIRTLKFVGVLDWSHRANILTGKDSNLYRFKFEGIRFNRDKLSKADYAAIESKLKRARKSVTAEMAADSSLKKPNIAPSIPSQMLRHLSLKASIMTYAPLRARRGLRYRHKCYRYRHKCYVEVITTACHHKTLAQN